MDRQYTRRFNQLRAHIDEMLGNGAIITERAPLMIKSGEVLYTVSCGMLIGERRVKT